MKFKIVEDFRYDKLGKAVNLNEFRDIKLSDDSIFSFKEISGNNKVIVILRRTPGSSYNYSFYKLYINGIDKTNASNGSQDGDDYWNIEGNLLYLSYLKYAINRQFNRSYNKLPKNHSTEQEKIASISLKDLKDIKLQNGEVFSFKDWSSVSSSYQVNLKKEDNNYIVIGLAYDGDNLTPEIDDIYDNIPYWQYAYKRLFLTYLQYAVDRQLNHKDAIPPKNYTTIFLSDPRFEKICSEYLKAQEFEKTKEFKKLQREDPSKYVIRNIKNPEKVVIKDNDKLNFICDKNHFYSTHIKNRTSSGTGCSECAKNICSSKTERLIYDKALKLYDDAILDDRNTLFYTRQLKNRTKEQYRELDIYIPSKKIAIEVDTDYTHKDSEKDLFKNKLCQHYGITLFRFRGYKGLKGVDSNIIKIPRYKNHCYTIEYNVNRQQEFNDALNILLKMISTESYYTKGYKDEI